MRGMHGGHGALLGRGYFHQLPSTWPLVVAEIEMIPHQQQKRIVPGKLMGAPHGVAIAQRLFLLDELQLFAMYPGGGSIALDVTRANHNTNLFRTGLDGFLDDDGQRSLGFAVTIHESLQGKRPLPGAGGCNHGFSDVHKRIISTNVLSMNWNFKNPQHYWITAADNRFVVHPSIASLYN
jgi:hypothetical protein